MFTRELTKGECSIIERALVAYGQQLQEYAYEARRTANFYSSEQDDRSGKFAEQAQQYEEKVVSIFNLETFIKRGAVSLNSIVVLPEQA